MGRHVARMGIVDVYTGFLVGKRREKEDPGIDGRKILRRISMKKDGAWTGLIWFRIGTGCGHL